jgi:Xaa-Pro dipeptidase
VTPDRVFLLTRSADLRQAQLTSNIEDIRLWRDGQDVDPTADLWTLLQDLDLAGAHVGWETNTHGLTAMNGQRVAARLEGRATLAEASDLVDLIRLPKSPAEIAYTRRAAELADDAFDAGVAVIGPGADEAEILTAMQGEILRQGGDYPGNEFIIGSGDHALLCRYQSGRRKMAARDQITLEWAGAWRHYHSALMRTVVVGEPLDEHLKMQDAAEQALAACEAALIPGRLMHEVFDAHVATFDGLGLSKHRLNACGYALGPRFAPGWMENQMFYANASTPIMENAVYFLHMILMDSDSGAALTLGRTSLCTANGAEPLSRLSLELPRR